MGGFKEVITHCHFHPTEMLVGVCALCLKEKLLTLASEDLIKSIHEAHKNLPKAFAFGGSLPQHHLKLKCQSSNDNARKTAFSGNEELFISVKFGDDGNRLSNKGSASSRPHLEVCNPTSTFCFNKDRRRTTSIMEHRRPIRTISWRKRPGWPFIPAYARENSGLVVMKEEDGLCMVVMEIRDQHLPITVMSLRHK